MPSLLDISGMKFGRLTVLSYCGEKCWLVRCDCGTEKKMQGQAVRSGVVVSCGCFNKENAARLKKTHGQSKHPLFKTWEGMISRCKNERDKDWNDYGGRGIKVCDSWALSPATFFEDMGERPHRASLERVDLNGNYEPKNCVWATPMQQGANKRNNNRALIDGVWIHLAEAVRKYGLSESTIRNRMNKGMTMGEAVKMKSRSKRNGG